VRDGVAAHPVGLRAPFLFLCGLVGLLAAAEPGAAQVRTMVDRFPTPQQVLRDFGDDAGRRVALQILYFALQQKTLVPRSQAASDRITAYFRAFGEIDYKYTRMGAQSAAYKAYFARVRQLLADTTFAGTVLARYGIASLPPERPAGAPLGRTPTAFGRARPDLTAKIVAAVPQALPYWLAALLVVALIPLVFWRFFDAGSPAGALRAGPDDEFQLPQARRVLHILGKHLALDMTSGIVIGVDTSGGHDRLWIREVSGSESTAAFASGIFPVREGHIVTFGGDGRVLTDGGPDYFFAYNHAMTKFVAFSAIETAMRPRRSALPWLISTVVGAVAFWLGLATLVQHAGPVVRDGVEWGPIVLLGAGLVAVLAWLSARLTARILYRMRLRRFSGFKNMLRLMAFFGLLKPKLEAHFGTGKPT
jgi:hypothetical protein